MKKFLYVVALNCPVFSSTLELPFFVDKIIDLHDESNFTELLDNLKRRFSFTNELNVCITYIGRVKLSSEHDFVFFDLKKE